MKDPNSKRRSRRNGSSKLQKPIDNEPFDIYTHIEHVEGAMKRAGKNLDSIEAELLALQEIFKAQEDGDGAQVS